MTRWKMEPIRSREQQICDSRLFFLVFHLSRFVAFLFFVRAYAGVRSPLSLSFCRCVCVYVCVCRLQPIGRRDLTGQVSCSFSPSATYTRLNHWLCGWKGEGKAKRRGDDYRQCLVFFFDCIFSQPNFPRQSFLFLYDSIYWCAPSHRNVVKHGHMAKLIQRA